MDSITELDFASVVDYVHKVSINRSTASFNFDLISHCMHARNGIALRRPHRHAVRSCVRPGTLMDWTHDEFSTCKMCINRRPAETLILQLMYYPSRNWR